jgi:hypothetical protein
MICMHCSTAQKAGQYCQNCHIRLAKYYCDKVHFSNMGLMCSVIYGMILLPSPSIIAQIVVSVVLEKD